MKKVFKLLLLAIVSSFALASCEDVPMPYANPNANGGNGESENSGSLPYSSASLNSDWSATAVSGTENPWSQGSSYTQATGYQKWDGTTKSNKEVNGYLVSPKFSTTAESNKVKMSFDYCVGYANNDASYAEHIKILASLEYEEGEIDESKWSQIDWKATHTSTDWTLKTEEIQLPDSFVNKENVRIAFWFYASADKSCTFEIKNFKLEEGVAAESSDTTGTTPDDTTTETKSVTCAEAAAIGAMLEDKATTDTTYSVTGYITEVPGNVSNNQQTFWMADTKDGGQVFEGYWANLPEGETAFVVGSKITMTGKIMRYGSIYEIKNGTVVILEKGEGGTPDDDTTKDDDTNKGETLTSLVNGDFEEWTSDSQPTGWKSASTASSATLKKSEDAHGGNFAVAVVGNESQNKRLASQEIELEAGTYKFAFYAKATSENAAQVRPGYVPVTDGSVGSYVYGNYTSISTEWTLVEYEFTLSAKTTICLVVMNPKKSSYSSGEDVLIDDATLTK